LAVAGLPCLTLLALVLPSWQRPLWSMATGFDSGNQFSLTLELAPGTKPVAFAQKPQTSPTVAGASDGDHGSSNGTREIAARFNGNWVVFGLVVWFAGAGLVLISVAVGQIRLREFSRKARPLQGADWALLMEKTCETLRLRRAVNLMQSTDNVMPLTWGWWHPVVLLPAETGQWPLERRRIILLHELAHVKRRDCLTQFAVKIICALYWFNPLVWLAARQMRIERECACDDLVLNGGCKASDYAGHLVEVAGSFRRVPQVAAIAMARSSQLEGRVAAIVDASRNRRLRSATALTILAVIAAIALGLGGSETNSNAALQFPRAPIAAIAPGPGASETNSNAALQFPPAPWRISAERAWSPAESSDFDSDTRKMIYHGHVRVDMGNLQIKLACEWLECEWLEAILPGQGRHMYHIVAGTNVVIDHVGDKGQTIHATSDKAVYFYEVQNGATNETLTLTGNAQVKTAYGPQAGDTCTGDTIIWDRVKNQVQVTGHVKTSQSGSNQIHVANALAAREQYMAGAAAGTNLPAVKTNLPSGTIENIDKITIPSH
jgi:beta-lactamase regulating signal transducer with metallopeptidase domain/lipopolysaccharide export system protein LptA